MKWNRYKTTLNTTVTKQRPEDRLRPPFSYKFVKKDGCAAMTTFTAKYPK